jgi:two-component system chemotaxis sensor kinase CheA
MSPLLEQFLSEARDFLQGISEKLMQLEAAPDDRELMNELFRLVHTFKGNSGLFDFPELTRVLHAGEDLMDSVRDGRLGFSRELADRLLEAMDLVAGLCDDIAAKGGLDAGRSEASTRLAERLRELIPASAEVPPDGLDQADPVPGAATTAEAPAALLVKIPEAARMAAFCEARPEGVFLVRYAPDEGCYYRGEDPFHQARQTPGLVWGGLSARAPWPRLEALDAYCNKLDFQILTTASRPELLEHFRYALDQVTLIPLAPLLLALPAGDPHGGAIYEDFVAEALNHLEQGHLLELERAARILMEFSNPDLWLSSALRWITAVLEKEPHNRMALKALITSLRSLDPPDWVGLARSDGEPGGKAMDPSISAILAIQKGILGINDHEPWKKGRIQAAAATVSACLRAAGRADLLGDLDRALGVSLEANHGAALIAWLDQLDGRPVELEPPIPAALAPQPPAAEPAQTEEVRYGRRAEDAPGIGKSLKVDQVKIDRLMNLIGEMVVSKNALPYLAGRAETVFGVRELSREIKAQYAVINRIAEEMQDAIMQVRMLPVSFVFQRFQRLVRDTSRKLGKEVNLVLVGEETEADKNVIEALGDPLVHIIRNSLDHGFEQPDVRLAAGKPAAGTLTIRASQEADHVRIEILDDGKGIDPQVIKRKALEKGLIDEATRNRMSDQEAIQLIFAAGFSTAEAVSDLSGRGVGMDVVRTAVAKLNGTVQLESEAGKGTRICLSLPLSMAVSNVMIIESDGQVFGVPMDCVVETVRVHRSQIRLIKQSQTTILRGRIIALKPLNALLGLASAPKANDQGELAVLVVRLGDEAVGLLVDQFRETTDVILKPLTGVLDGLHAYAGSALMGDGSVLMVLNIKEIL